MQESAPVFQDACPISKSDRIGLYKTILARRDVRAEFKPDPIPDHVLSRVLMAAHLAPSVGFMQPWNFVVIRSPQAKRKVHDAFLAANAEAAEMFDAGRRERYRRLKLEGIMEAPVNVCVTCDRDRAGPVVIGRTHIPIMDQYSAVCAVQNLWLAARAEGLGVGWVSILRQSALRGALGIPTTIIPIAYLCVGYVARFRQRPELEDAGWLPRLPLQDLVFFDRWGGEEGEPGGLTSRIAEAMALARQGRFMAAIEADGGA